MSRLFSLLLSLAIAALSMIACDKTNDSAETDSTDSTAGTGTMSDSNSVLDSESDTAAVTSTGADSATIADTGTGTIWVPDSGMVMDTNTAVDTGTVGNTDSVTNSTSDTDSHTETAGMSGEEPGSDSDGSSESDSESYSGFSAAFVYAPNSSVYLVAQDDQGTTLAFLADKAEDGLPVRPNGIAIYDRGEIQRYEFNDQGRLTRAQTPQQDVYIDYANLAEGTLSVETILPTGYRTMTTQSVTQQDMEVLTVELPDSVGVTQPTTQNEFLEALDDVLKVSVKLYNVIEPLASCGNAASKYPIYLTLGLCAVSALDLSERTNKIVSYLKTGASLAVCVISAAEVLSGVLTIPGVMGLVTTCPSAAEGILEALKDLTNPGGGIGDPHLFTFDRYFYDLQRVGEFLFVRDDDGEHIIQVRLAPYGESRSVAIIKSIAANVDGTIAEVGAAPATFYVDGAESGATSLSGGGMVSPTNFVWADGASLEIANRGTYLDVSARLPTSPIIVGLLGDADGDPTNDLALRDGTVLARPLSTDQWDEFADSWRITQEESLFLYGPDETTETYTDLTFPDNPVTAASLNHDVYTEAKKICEAAGILDEVLLDACILDVGIAELDDSFATGWADVPEPSAAAPAIYNFTVDAESMNVDKLSTFGLNTDGAVDGAFDVSLRGPVTVLVLLAQTATGAVQGHWNTVSSIPLPPEIPSSYSLSGRYYLRVEKDGQLINQDDGSLSKLDDGIHHLKVYSANGSLSPNYSGLHFRLYGILPNGHAMQGPEVVYP
jgi:hypothetical protein